MFLVGLTGGIASGKSSVIQVFQQLGCAVIDVDVIARHGELGTCCKIVHTAPLCFLFSIKPPHLFVRPSQTSEEGKAFLSALSDVLLSTPPSR